MFTEEDFEKVRDKRDYEDYVDEYVDSWFD